MSVLGDKTIRKFSTTTPPLITSFSEDCLQGASYDLRMGASYIVTDFKKGKEGREGQLNLHESFEIPAHGICYIETKEKLSLPDDITASLSLRLGLIRKSVFMANQPPIDPTYGLTDPGPIWALLYNLSSRPVSIREGDHVLSIEFRETDDHAGKKYRGKYTSQTKLRAFVDTSMLGGLAEIHHKLNKWRQRLESSIPIIIMIQTIMITILVLFVTGVFSAGMKCGANQPMKQVEETTRTIESNSSSEVHASDSTSLEPVGTDTI